MTTFSPAKDPHEAVVRALNETEFVNESEVTSGTGEMHYYRWQLPGSFVASEFIYHLHEQGYEVVRKRNG